ncbi:hypothetical protein L484_006690 [Morus notabilis]|uniref:Late embryogenesis abundant protein LEA-2 subgroup domain-containing protein n=1 Tax=Morus notabilis TaxID=981085 RepID=W9SZD3_9ROSA|nr:late embryogenesis abundant protein At1g64065 [Morus notabilis]EXC34335.1 hypothetical protein L484_006690 [Morus notabilis]
MADQESQSWPLAPMRVHQRSDEENPAFKALRKERTNKCFVYIFAGIVILGAILLIFALIVLRSKSPEIKLKSVTVKSLDYSTSPWPSLNATLIATVAIKNPNFGPYRFGSNNSAVFLYGGGKLGEQRIRQGKATAKATKRVNVTVEIRTSRLPQGSNNLGGDLSSGMVNLSSYCKFTGRVHLIKIFENRKTAEMNCAMTLVLKTKMIKNLRCD